jgi:hypothetical protein
MLEQAGKVQERRLASARRRHQCHRLARPERKLGVLEYFERRGALAVGARNAVQNRTGASSSGQRIGRRRDRRVKGRGEASFITQRLDRIEPGRAPGRIQGCEQRVTPSRPRRWFPRRPHRQAGATGNRAPDPNRVVPVNQDRNWRIDSILRHTSRRA